MAASGTLSQSLPWLARIIAQQCKVSVRFDPRASAAYTTSRGEIVLPALPGNDPQTTALTLGYLVHEAAHARFTDFEVRKGASAHQEGLHQVIEDLRVERAIQVVLPGASGYLYATWSLLYQEGKVQRPGDQPAADPYSDLWAWLLSFCRWQSLGLEEAGEDMAKGKAHMVHHVGQELTEECESIFDACTLCSNTLDTYERADDLLRLLGLLPRDRDDDAQPAAANEDLTTFSDAYPDIEPGAEAEAEAAADPFGGGDDAAPGVGDLLQSTRSSGQASGVPSESTGRGETELGLQAAQVLAVHEDPMSEGARELMVLLRTKAQQGAFDEGKSLRLQVGASVSERVRKASPGDGAALYGRAKASTVALRARLHHLLQTLTESKVEVGRRGRPLVTELWRLRTGNANVFELEEDGPELDTAVTLLLDVSGSMKGTTGSRSSPIELVKLAAMAVTHALDGVRGLECAVYAFPGEQGSTLQVSRVKGFHQHARQASSAIAGLFAEGGTPLAEALYAVGPEVAASRKELKVLILISDGDPNDVPSAREALASAECQGIEVLGLGVQHDLSHLIRRCEQIDSAEQLAPALFKLFSQRQAEFLRKAA